MVARLEHLHKKLVAPYLGKDGGTLQEKFRKKVKYLTNLDKEMR